MVPVNKINKEKLLRNISNFFKKRKQGMADRFTSMSYKALLKDPCQTSTVFLHGFQLSYYLLKKKRIMKNKNSSGNIRHYLYLPLGWMAIDDIS